MDSQQRIVLVLMIFVTAGWLIWAQRQRAEELARQAEAERQAPAPPPPAVGGEQALPAAPSAVEPPSSAPPATPGGDAAEAPEPAEVREIRVRTANYEALFTSRGAALKRYSLQRYFRTTEQEVPLVLVDEVVPGQTSLLLARLGETADLQTRNYTVLEAPAPDAPAQAEQRLVFQTTVDQWRVTKTYRFGPTGAEPVEEAEAEKAPKAFDYGFALTVAVENLAPAARDLSWRFQAVAGVLPDDLNARFGLVETVSATTRAAEDVDEILRHGVAELPEWPGAGAAEPSPEALVKDARAGLQWYAAKGRFFTALVRHDRPGQPEGEVVQWRVPLTRESAYVQALPESYREALLPVLESHPHAAVVEWRSVTESAVPSQARRDVSLFFYGGPVREAELAAVDPACQGLVTYTWAVFDFISRLVSRLLHVLSTVVPNMGVCVILLTLIIKTSMHGLTRRALASGHKMQKLQPLMKEIRKKYENDQAKLQQETMRLWREHGVSPWGACLPMLIQMPIFFALFGTFARDFSMRQAMFIPGWIEDLSQQDALFDLPFTVPFVGWETFNLLPILYVGLQLFQQSMTPKSQDPQMQQQQQMMKMMPIIFMFIFYVMPSGLVLYFTISAGYTLVEHWFIRQRLEGDAGGGGPAASAGDGTGQDGRTPVAAGVGMGSRGKKKR